MGKRRNDSLSRKTGTRGYRTVCWVSTEGFTEKDYFSMDVFRDVDVWDAKEFEVLLAWKAEDTRHHVIISNPKFELFLVMHFEKGNGCTTAAKVDAALKRYMPGYNKRLNRGQFSSSQVREASVASRAKRTGSKEAIPAPGMTDAHLLVERLPN